MAKTGASTAKKLHRKDRVVRAAFASIVVQRRRKLKLKQRQVAELSGYSEKYIGLLERRRNTPSLTAAIMISGALQTDSGEFVNEVRSLLPRFKRLEGKDHDAADS
jgi:transcriptional regulator with XRE-family HTH domain